MCAIFQRNLINISEKWVCLYSYLQNFFSAAQLSATVASFTSVFAAVSAASAPSFSAASISASSFSSEAAASPSSSPSEFSASASEFTWALSEFSGFLFFDRWRLGVFLADFFNPAVHGGFEFVSYVFSSKRVYPDSYSKLASDGSCDFSSLPSFCVVNKCVLEN
jgi:hypothetical protein